MELYHERLCKSLCRKKQPIADPGHEGGLKKKSELLKHSRSVIVAVESQEQGHLIFGSYEA